MTTSENTSVALITGVSRAEGLGFETARQLGRQGYTVLLTARDLDKASALASQLVAEQIRAIALQLDTLSDQSVADAARQLDAQFSRLDVLINNAAAYFDAGGDVLNADLNYVRDALETNLIGTWRVTQGLVPLLRKSQHGRIVNVSSGAGSFSDPIFGLTRHPQNVPVYGLTKLALNGFTVKLAKQLQPEKILVNAVCPGWVATYPGTAEWGARPVPDGARGIVWAATLPDDGPTGDFFRDGEPLGW